MAASPVTSAAAKDRCEFHAMPGRALELRRPLQCFFIQPRPIAQHTVSILTH